MTHPTPATASTELLLQLLQNIPEQVEPATRLAELDPSVLDYLRTKASDLHTRAINAARDLLDVALESVERPLSPEHQRRLIERADDELASAQRWGELAANARFCREHPELARELAGPTSISNESTDVNDGKAVGKQKRAAKQRVR